MNLKDWTMPSIAVDSEHLSLASIIHVFCQREKVEVLAPNDKLLAWLLSRIVYKPHPKIRISEPFILVDRLLKVAHPTRFLIVPFSLNLARVIVITQRRAANSRSLQSLSTLPKVEFQYGV